VRQDVRDVGGVVEKFTGAPGGAGGNLPLRSVKVGVGPGLCYLDAVEPEPTRSGPESDALSRVFVERNTCVRSPGFDANITRGHSVI
jgi:hypothetical protein